LAIALGAFAHEPKTEAPKAHNSDASMQLHRIMMDGAKMPMTMPGNIDRDFATMMSMPHARASKIVDVYRKARPQRRTAGDGAENEDGAGKEIKPLAPFAK
jgi:hypothetical protein